MRIISGGTNKNIMLINVYGGLRVAVNEMKNRRKVKDRRDNNYKQDLLFPCNRRNRPDRRLNSISVEFIPLDSFYLFRKYLTNDF